jgi:hypothetical protein
VSVSFGKTNGTLSRKITAMDLTGKRNARLIVLLILAQKLTYLQLADHLPETFGGLCTAFELEDLKGVEPAIVRREKAWRDLLASGLPHRGARA